jgi:serine/threonine-protein kinase HipA
VPSALQVWLHDEHVATITGSRTGAVTCTYTERAMDLWSLNLPILSCSLPLRSGRTDARYFFRGLLPEGDALRAMADAAGVLTTDTVGMLSRFGRDVAGALVIAGAGPSTRDASYVPYDDASLAAEVANLEQTPLALHDDSELSIAGLQNKLLLVRTADGWARPQHGYPSTHILKVEDRRFPGLVAHEAAALRLAHAVGLTRVQPEVMDVGGLPCLLVNRFDRDRNDPPRRVHQEDACQALGLNPEAAAGRGKYESAGGPSYRDVAALLDRHSLDGPAQLERLLAAATFTVVIGNADAHGKNLALLHAMPGVIELAPLYDTVPTALFPTLREEAAMFVNERMRLVDITFSDLVAEAETWMMNPQRAASVVEASAVALRDAVGVADITSQLGDHVTRRCQELLDGRGKR